VHRRPQRTAAQWVEIVEAWRRTVPQQAQLTNLLATLTLGLHIFQLLDIGLDHRWKLGRVKG
jgi:hypothetical protein